MLQEARLRQPPEIEHHFEQHVAVWVFLQHALNVWGHYPKQQSQVIRYAYVFPDQRLHLPPLGRMFTRPCSLLRIVPLRFQQARKMCYKAYNMQCV